MASMAVAAVIFDWGGTLTPWHSIDHEALWLEVCTPHFPQADAASVATAILAAAGAFWQQGGDAPRSGTLEDVLARARGAAHPGLRRSCYRARETHARA